jgi:hypothetical protein
VRISSWNCVAAGAAFWVNVVSCGGAFTSLEQTDTDAGGDGGGGNPTTAGAAGSAGTSGRSGSNTAGGAGGRAGADAGAPPAGRVARVDRVVDRVARVAAPDRAARLTPVAPPEARGKPTPVDETETLSPMHSDLTALTDRPGAVDPSTPTRERIFPRALSTQDRSARAGHQAIARSVARWRIQRECANISSACMAVRAAIAIRSVQ